MKDTYWTKEKSREKRKPGKSLLIAIFALIALFIAGYAAAAPNQMTVQGKLTNTAGAAIASTTVNLTFRIYDSFTGGNQFWEYKENITTDANGVYDVILKNLNLTFADQYYLGVTISSDNESSPRINLTSSPYSFRANISEDLNQNNSYAIRNLSVTGNTTIGSDGLSTVNINTISLNLTLTHLNYSGSLGIDSNSYFLGNLGIGKIIPTSRLDIVGDVSIAGPLNASSLNVTGNAFLAINTGSVGIGTTAPNYLFQTAGGTDGRSVNLSNVLFINASTGSVGINITNPSTPLHVIGKGNFTQGVIVGNTDTGDTGAIRLSSGVFQGFNGSDWVTLGNSSLNSIAGGWTDAGSSVYVTTTSDNVGIGTINPDSLLTISGNELTANAILHVNESDSFNTSVINAITLDHILKNPVNSTGGIGISILFRATDNASQLANIGNISAILYNSTNGSQLSAITFSTRNADIGDGSFGHLLERMRIDGHGRVGLNTTTPSEVLDVFGNVKLSTTAPLINISGAIIRKSGNDIVISD